MWDEDFSEFDTDKEKWLFDIASFRRWQIDEHNENGSSRKRLTSQELLKYKGLRKQALGLYQQFNQMTSSSPKMRIRFFRYLAGESMDDIARSENPPVCRQAIQKSLKQVSKGESLKRLRLIYFYGRHYGGRIKVVKSSISKG